MKLLRTSAVLLAATAAAAAAMLATSAIDGARPSTILVAVRPATSSAAADPAVSQAPVSQDYRTSLLLLQTGRMTFGQLWFAASR